MQTFLSEDSVCIGHHTTSSSIWNLFAWVCFSKKYQTGKNLLHQNSSSKHPHNAIRSAQHLNPVSRATSKLPIKIAAPDWFLNISIFFANHGSSLSDNWIIFPRFCTQFTYRLFTVHYFSVSSSRSTALVTGGYVPWICMKSTFSPHSPDITPTCYKPRHPPLGTNGSKMAASTGTRTILKLHCSQPIRFNKPNRL